jgi:hypothetical protein
VIFSLLKKFLITTVLIVSAAQIQTIQDYAEQLPFWGTSWSPGNDSIGSYYPSFYVGFAPRSEYPSRIHIRTARGNQTRVSVILDEQTVKDYMYDLVYRDNFYKEATGGDRPAANVNIQGAALPQMEFFSQVVNSPQYDIPGAIQANLPSEQLYQKSLQMIIALNPGRVFVINLDLNKEYARWKTIVASVLDGRSPEAVFTADAKETIIALDSLVWGRVNLTEAPSTDLISKLQATAAAAMASATTEQFAEQATELFSMATANKYQIKTVDQNGQWTPAIACNQGSCRLSYPEFTAIYPTGSHKSYKNDDFGNSIPHFATPGLWSFLERSYHEVDHIRDESYYGWAPKMDFEAIGNGFHNPAVRFNGDNFSKTTREALRAPPEHTQLWAVKRGGVSSGCLRLSLGHVWEMRHIMPVENDKMKQVYFFGNNSTDFDLYDVNGDGNLEVMGLEYQITYDTKGSSGLDKREGEELLLTADSREAYYKGLYGSKSVFEKMGESFVFNNPEVSFPSHLDYQVKKANTTYVMEGQFPLYEQVYEQDKVQFYMPYSTSGMSSSGQPESAGKRMVRLMGRVRGCAPDSDKVACGEAAFAQEKDIIFGGR